MKPEALRPPRALPPGLIALALGGFGIGLTEFVVAGILPDIAEQLRISEAASGWIISAYALAVAVGAFGVTIATSRMPRKHVLLQLVGLFIVGNALCALAPSYPILLLGRVVAALCHGAFFGTGAVVAASLVTPDRRGRAIGLMFGGLTVANVLGVPAGTLVGEQLGWRATFAGIAFIGVLVLAGVATLVPADAGGTGPLQLRAELSALVSPQVWLSLAVTVFGFGGMFGAFSLISYPLSRLSGYPPEALPWLLVLFGVGLVVGNAVGGRAADRARDRSVLAFLVALAVILATFAATAHHPAFAAVLLFLMGVFGFAITPGIQTRVLDHAPAAATLASSANIAAFNVGNALAAWLGAGTLGYSAASPLIVGAIMAAMAAALLIVASRLERRGVGE
jgi:MFS transporter, DHA1 family, inner membrane transport protein